MRVRIEQITLELTYNTDILGKSLKSFFFFVQSLGILIIG